MRAFRLKPLMLGTADGDPLHREEDFPERRSNDFQPHLGLKKVRKAAKLTQEEMARETGVSRKSYQLYEAGKLPIPSDKIGKLARRFGFDVHELFCGAPFTNPAQLKVECAQVGIIAFQELRCRFRGSDMTPEEMQRIAMIYAKHHEEGSRYSYLDLLNCVVLVTGHKYVEDPNDPFFWDFEDDQPD